MDMSGIEVFISYCHQDEALLQELVKHLSTLQRQGLIQAWHDRLITPGTEWAGQLDAHLNSARVILLLVSADFLASDYCYDIEMKRALARHEAGEARVIPVILRPVDWQGAPFGKLQALPLDGKPITKWPDRDEALVNVAQGIRRAIAAFTSPAQAEPTAIITQRRRDYYRSVLQNLSELGCLEHRQEVRYNSQIFRYVSRFLDFRELGFRMQGEAFFIFSDFDRINPAKLQQFLLYTSEWARQEVNPDTAGKVFFNFKLPTHCCFAVAVVDQVDEATATAVRTMNPFGKQVDLMWYEVPVIYSLSQQELYFYEKAANLLENFRGEIVWKKLREIVEKLLSPGVHFDGRGGTRLNGGDH